jgi:hypothetical protein
MPMTTTTIAFFTFGRFFFWFSSVHPVH